MEENDIELALNESFSDFDNDFIDPDFIPNQNNSDNSLDGIQLLESDSESEICTQEPENDVVVVNSSDTEEPTSGIQGKKRKVNTSLWVRKIAKAEQAKGVACVSLRQKPIKKRQTGPDCM